MDPIDPLGRCDADTLPAALQALVEENPQQLLLHDPQSGLCWTRSEFAKAAATLAGALRGRFPVGFSAGLLMGNRAEYFLSDMAVLLCGGLPVSLYPTSSVEQLRYVLGHAGIAVVFAESARLAPLLQAALEGSPLQLIVLVDVLDEADIQLPPGCCTVITLRQLTATEAPGIDLAEMVAAIRSTGLLTLIYTSGTTGQPKGVRLTHGNLLAAARGIGQRIGLRSGDRIISWLPHAHVAERTCHYCCALLFGLEVTFCADAQQLPALLHKVRPDWFGAFPRFWEKLKQVAEGELARRAAPERLHRSLRDAREAVRLRGSGSPVPGPLAERVSTDDAELFAPLRTALGLERARSLNTGSAPTSLEVLEFFSAVGLPIGEMYGASETCTYGALNTPGRIRLGSVGTCAPGMELRIDGDGEILIRGASVMQGYHLAADKDAEVFTADGFYRTGDLGHLDEDGYLWITGRKKELIINASGHNMSPAHIEAMLKSGSPLIGQVCVVGEARPYNVALVVLDAEQAQAMARRLNAPQSAQAPDQHPLIQAAVQLGVAAGNARLARVEQVKRFCILPGDWLPGGDELTQTLKLRRNRIGAKYAELIEQLYQPVVQAPCLEPLARNHSD
ncbi:MAG: AMP-binding protein [Pseudomonas sp.]